MKKNRVVITGAGCLTPVGNDLLSTWHNLVKGRSGIDFIRNFDASTFPCRIAGEVKNFNPSDYIKEENLLKYSGRIHQLGTAAATMAVEDAQINFQNLLCEKIGVAIGATGQYPDLEQLNYYSRFGKGNQWDFKTFIEQAQISPTWVFHRSVQTVSCMVAKLFKIAGPNISIHTACASGSHAIGQAFRIIQRGDADIMIAGGTDAIASPLWVAAFILLGALSTRSVEPEKASRPFDAKREGFVISEGAGILILESLTHAVRRKAQIYAEISGYGTSLNAFRVTDSPLDGAGARLAMERAIVDAGIQPEDIQYINAHGTSTIQNDIAETNAIKSLFGEKAHKIPISAIKSTIGHLMSASGALATLSTAMTLKEGIIPPTINYEFPDPDCDLDYVPNNMRKKIIEYGLVNAFGFGGQNVSLVLRKWNLNGL